MQSYLIEKREGADMKNKVIIGLVLFLVICFGFRKNIARWISSIGNPDNTKKKVLQLVNDQVTSLENVTLLDGSVYSESFYEVYQTTAQSIAQAQYNNLNSNNVDEDSLFSQVVNLQGNQLVAVYKAFGSRQWISQVPLAPTIHANLFEWYSYQLCDNFLCSFETGNLVNETVIGCDSWADSIYCYEGTFMGAIWYKSLLPTNIFTDLTYYGIDDEQDAYYQNLLDQMTDEEEG